MKKSIAILFITALTLAACQSASQASEVSKTSEVSPTDTPQPTAVVATESQPQISPEVQAKFDENELSVMTNDEKLNAAPELDQHDKWRATGQYVLYVDQNDEVMKAFDR